ncbi:MAG TPA: phospholipase D family protein, partial [Gammaproteobacteria bacterium]|nr:phospholipase D family protein [Gammaproteobacteria bacterium]
MHRFWLLLLLTGLTACAGLPEAPPRPASHAFTDTQDTALARSVAPLLQAHPGQDGFILLENGLDAFVARAALAEYAGRSIDVQ